MRVIGLSVTDRSTSQNTKDGTRQVDYKSTQHDGESPYHNTHTHTTWN